MSKQALVIMIFVLAAKFLPAQTCTATGQTPSSAVLICGSDVVVQDPVAFCGQTTIPTSCIDGASHQNLNPYWYKLACFSSGNLGFTITPKDLNENYDWQLFDGTARNPDDVFTVPSIFVACNWSIDPGVTGASVDGTSLTVCSSPGEPAFSMMPDLQTGHEYLLMVSHKTPTTNGFQLEFSGGSAGITDPFEPKMIAARISCDGSKVIVKLNRGMKCSSISADGTDFTVSGATITSAFSGGCGTSATTDSVILSLNTQLPLGTYTLTIQNGTDGNTLTDICGRDIPFGDQLSFLVAPLQPTPFDSVRTSGCGPSSVQLIFSRPIQCSSIAADASDFIISGPQPVTISNITSACNSGTNPPSTAAIINLQLASPIVIAGNYQISLINGSDGNTVIDECGRLTPAGNLFFTVKGAASASFTYSLKPSCKNDTLVFAHPGGNGINNWNWTFDNSVSSNLQNPVQVYPASGKHTARLIVTNGACSDTSLQTITLDNKIVAAFDMQTTICPGDTVSFINKSSGTVDGWQWDFGNGTGSNLKTPGPMLFYPVGRESFYSIKLIASSVGMNCSDIAVHAIRVLGSCLIAVPGAFTPNDDGLNDYLYPLNAFKADNLEFKVYNRMGQLLFFTRDWTRKWNGKINGIVQTTGVYAWTLSFTYHDTGEKVFMKGTTLLLK